MSINFQIIQSVFNAHSAFFKNKQGLNSSQLSDCKDKDDAIRLMLKKLILELSNKPNLSKNEKKFLDHLKKRLEELNLKKKQPKTKLEKALDFLMMLGEELGDLIMAILTGTADKIFTYEEKLLMQEKFDEVMAALIHNKQMQPQSKLNLERFVAEMNQKLVKYNQVLNQERNTPVLSSTVIPRLVRGI